MQWRTSSDGIVHSYLVDDSGVIKAWVLEKTEGAVTWYWLKFDFHPPRGPFQTEDAVKVAAELMCNDNLDMRLLIDVYKRR